MSRAAPARERVLAQAQFETRALLSNGEQLLVSMILPLLALVALGIIAPAYLGSGQWGTSEPIDVLTPGVLALAVVSTAFTGQAIVLAYERRYGVLRLLGTTPLGRTGLLLSKGAAVLVVVSLQSLVLAGAGLVAGWRPDPTGIPSAVCLVLLGCAAFVSLALLLGGRLRAEAVLAFANLAWVLFLGCGLLFPLAAFPPALATVIGWTPPGALGEGLRLALTGTTLWPAGPALVLIGWALVTGLLAARGLRWSD